MNNTIQVREDEYVIEAQKLAKKVIWRRPKVNKDIERIEEAPLEIKQELNWVRDLEKKKDPLANFKIVKVFPRKIYLRKREELTQQLVGIASGGKSYESSHNLFNGVKNKEEDEVQVESPRSPMASSRRTPKKGSLNSSF